MRRFLILCTLCLMSISAMAQWDDQVDREQLDRRIFSVTPEWENFPTPAELIDLRISPGDVIRTTTSEYQEYTSAGTWQPWPSGVSIITATVLTSSTATIEIINSTTVTIEAATVNVLHATTVYNTEVYITNVALENIYNTTNLTQILSTVYNISRTQIDKEELAGTVDGSNTAFTSAYPIVPNSWSAYLLDRHESSYPLPVDPMHVSLTAPNTITFTTAPIATDPYTLEPITVEVLLDYESSYIEELDG